MVWALVAAIMLLAVVAFRLAAWVTDVESEARRADQVAQERIAAATERVASLERTAQEQSLRLGSLEARLEGRPDPADTAAAVRPGVVAVSSGDGGPGGGLGTGFVLASVEGSSVIVTNYHVVAEQWTAQVRTVTVHRDGESFLGAVERVWEADDLAVITTPRTLPTLTVAEQPAKAGDRVLVVGYPPRRGWSVAGAVIAENSAEHLRFSTPVAPDERNGVDVDGGGVVVDADGHVVGVVTTQAGTEKVVGLSSVVPIAEVCKLVGIC